ncbi:hypothetical protein [Dactylosporangium sp. NPDC005555]|uniref:hypothetical protein n=1 Tax=Dactylosporangium sp. NPDC005555 TaxID=3154889 RepID=UPI0033B80639
MTRLGEVLDDIAEHAKLYDVTDKAVRVARRRRRVRKTTTAVMAMVLVLVVMVTVLPMFLFGGPGRPEGGPGRLDGVPPTLVQPLLDTPTRGSLAGDARYVGALLDRIVDEPEDFGLPGDRTKLRVLFVGDVPGNRRIALIAGITGVPRMVNLTGSGKAPVKDLDLTGWSDVEEPVVRDGWRGDKNEGYELILGPSGYDVSVSSAPQYMSDGTIQRTWTPEPAGYILRDTATLPRGLRVRMTKGDTVFFESAVASPGTVRAAQIDPTPLYGRGKPAPRAAQAAADALAYSTGLVGPGIQYVVLWSDDFVVNDPNGGGSGLGQIATVMAVTESGGGPYITVATDTNPEPNARTHPTGAGISGRLEQSVIAMRMPHFDETVPATLQIIAPPTAVRVDLLKGQEVVDTVPLTNGVGKLDLPGEVQLRVRALDAQGNTVAERLFKDWDGVPTSGGGYEPEIRGW